MLGGGSLAFFRFICCAVAVHASEVGVVVVVLVVALWWMSFSR